MAKLNAAWFAALFFLLIPEAAQAQLLDMTCQTFFDDNLSQAPKGIATFFAQARPAGENKPLGEAIERCIIKGDRNRYSLFGPVRYERGVCHFERSDISYLFSQSDTYLGPQAKNSSRWPPEGRMFATTDPCPRQDAAIYVTTNLSPGLFRALSSFWSGIFASERALQSAISLVPSDKRDPDFIKMVRSRFGHPTKLDGIGIQPEMWATETSGIQMSLTKPGSRGQGWILTVDLTDKGFHVLRIGRWIA
jgi:hypothetical protein